MKLHIGVVAHTSRGRQARELARQVCADFVSLDNGILGCDQNHKAVQWHLAALPGDYSVVLEDDAVPVDGFGDQLRALLEVAPAPVCSLYLGRQRPPQYQRQIADAVDRAESGDANWIMADRLFHAVGYAIRTDLLPSLLNFTTGLPSDEHVSAWAMNRLGAGQVCYCLPSIVDHADVPTVVDHPDGQPRPPGRTAWRVGARQVWSPSSVALTA